MTDQRIQDLEKGQSVMQITLAKIEAALGSIQDILKDNLSMRDTVITHTEKLKVTEARLSNTESDIKEIGSKISSINLKIAMVTGAWTVIMFILQHYLSK